MLICPLSVVISFFLILFAKFFIFVIIVVQYFNFLHQTHTQTLIVQKRIVQLKVFNTFLKKQRFQKKKTKSNLIFELDILYLNIYFNIKCVETFQKNILSLCIGNIFAIIFFLQFKITKNSIFLLTSQISLYLLL